MLAELRPQERPCGPGEGDSMGSRVPAPADPLTKWSLQGPTPAGARPPEQPRTPTGKGGSRAAPVRPAGTPQPDSPLHPAGSLELISTAANHSNAAIRKMVSVGLLDDA